MDKPHHIYGIEYGDGKFFLIGQGERRYPSTQKELIVYATKAYSGKNIADWEIDGEITTVYFHSAYGPLSSSDIEELSKPTGVTGLLRSLQGVGW
jgi:hypothetical protein